MVPGETEQISRPMYDRADVDGWTAPPFRCRRRALGVPIPRYTRKILSHMPIADMDSCDGGLWTFSMKILMPIAGPQDGLL